MNPITSVALSSDRVHAPFGPYSSAVRSGDTIYVSGQGPFDCDQSLVGETISDQARQSLENLRALLNDNGARLADVVKVTVYLSDIGDWAAFNDVYREFFTTSPLPARTIVGATLNGMMIELDCVAVLGIPQ